MQIRFIAKPKLRILNYGVNPMPDEKKELDKIAKLLEIDKILDNDIKKISGGELQRVAIAATVL